MKFIGTLVHEMYPNFSKEKAEKMKWTDNDEVYIEYYDSEPDTNGRQLQFAKYWPWNYELQIRPELFEFLETILGEVKMTYVLEWFNQEFNQDAELISF